MFILTKLPPLPPALNNLFNYLILFSIITLPAQAKIIQRKMHMICQEHESAYWDGSKGVCCDGNVYQPDTEDTSYACCPTGKEVSIVQGKENLNHCCSEGQKAYWNGSSAQCCDTTTHKLVKNYKNGVGEAGYACCEIKEDEITSDGPDESASTGWTVIGAANGSCCGGYTSYQNSIYGTIELQRTSTYTIRQNGEIYYCALEQTSSMYGELQQEDVYVSDSQFCKYFPQNGGETIINCTCSDSGDPRNGSSCDP